jgi:hypothetical protein
LDIKLLNYVNLGEDAAGQTDLEFNSFVQEGIHL